MPKNSSWGENTKAVQAKARKAAARNEENEKKAREAEDKLWEDNDKNLQRKQERKAELEKKQAEKLLKKVESQKLLEEELKTLKSAKAEKPVEKISKFEIDKMREKEEAARAAEAAEKAKKKIVTDEPELIENVNRIKIEGDVARNVDQAISILSGTDGNAAVDLHPEKRMKASYLEFEEENLERLKKENPNMRLSQIKQILKKDWQKSPKNPLNKVFL